MEKAVLLGMIHSCSRSTCQDSGSEAKRGGRTWGGCARTHLHIGVLLRWKPEDLAGVLVEALHDVLHAEPPLRDGRQQQRQHRLQAGVPRGRLLPLLLLQRVGCCGMGLVTGHCPHHCPCPMAAIPGDSPWSVAKQSMMSMFSQSASTSWRVPSSGRTAARPFPRRPRSSWLRNRWCGATSHVTGIPLCLAALIRRIWGSRG